MPVEKGCILFYFFLLEVVGHVDGEIGTLGFSNKKCFRWDVMKEVGSQVWREPPLENPAVGWSPDTPALQRKTLEN